MIDAELRSMIDAMVASGFVLPVPLEAAALRALMDFAVPAKPIGIAEVREVSFAGPAGDIMARL